MCPNDLEIGIGQVFGTNPPSGGNRSRGPSQPLAIPGPCTTTDRARAGGPYRARTGSGPGLLALCTRAGGGPGPWPVVHFPLARRVKGLYYPFRPNWNHQGGHRFHHHHQPERGYLMTTPTPTRASLYFYSGPERIELQITDLTAEQLKLVRQLAKTVDGHGLAALALSLQVDVLPTCDG